MAESKITKGVVHATANWELATDVAEQLEKNLRAIATPARAVQEKKYLKSHRDHLGVTVPQVRKEVIALLRATTWPTPRANFLELSRQLWAEDIYELNSSAVEILSDQHAHLEASDLRVLKQMISQAKTWALVDPLSTDVVGRLVDRLGIQSELDKWIEDDDFWIRRAAMLAWIRPLRAGASVVPFLKYADKLLDEKEFFIRKAIGWVLREIAKKRPEPVAKWVASRIDRMNHVTLKEAVKKLDAPTRDRILKAYKARKPAAKGALRKR